MSELILQTHDISTATYLLRHIKTDNYKLKIPTILAPILYLNMNRAYRYIKNNTIEGKVSS